MSLKVFFQRIMCEYCKIDLDNKLNLSLKVAEVSHSEMEEISDTVMKRDKCVQMNSLFGLLCNQINWLHGLWLQILIHDQLFQGWIVGDWLIDMVG